MKRRHLLTGASASALLGRAAWAQPGMTSLPAGLQPILPGPVTLGNGPSLSLDFVNAPSSATAGLTTTRAAGGATAFDATGTLQLVAANTPRIDYGYLGGPTAKGLLVEESRVNSIRNPRCEGAIAGTPGTMPTNWTIGNTGTTTIVGVGYENGIPFVDIAFTSTASGSATVWFDSKTLIAAVSGQVWTQSLYFRVVGGATTGIAFWVEVGEYTSGGAALASSHTVVTPTSAALGSQPFNTTRTLNNASTVFVDGQMDLVYTGATSVTLRIGCPQLELGAFATSPILPAIGTPAATTRAADAASFAMPTGFVGNQCSFAMRYILAGQVALSGRLLGGVANNSGPLFSQFAATGIGIYDTSSAVYTANAQTPGTVQKAASAISGTNASVCLNAGTIATSSALTTGFNNLIASGAQFFNDSANETASGWVQTCRIWNRGLSSAELLQVTA